MKRIALVLIALVVLAVLTTGTTRADDAARAAFAKLKSLAGEWQGQTKDGKTATLKNRLASNGTVLVEEFDVEGEAGMNMITMYHQDSDGVMLTHYCMSGNQPRMRAVPQAATPDQFTFTFVDATDLATPEEGHMHHVVLKLEDEDHMTQEWTFRKDGKDAFTEVVRYERTR